MATNVHRMTRTMKATQRSRLFQDVVNKYSPFRSTQSSLTRVTQLSMSSLDESDTIMNTPTPDSKTCTTETKYCRTEERTQKNKMARRSLFCGTNPIASSTMIDQSQADSTNATETSNISIFAPTIQSTMTEEFLPCANSTMLDGKKTVGSHCKSDLSGIETWTLDGSKDTALHKNYLRRHKEGNSNNKRLFQEKPVCASTPICALKAGKSDMESKVTKVPKFLRLLQALKNEKRTKQHLDKEQIETNNCVAHGGISKPECGSFQIRDRQSVARKLNRFRQSFRKQGLQQFQTLATL